jgi:hypothetical protein
MFLSFPKNIDIIHNLDNARHGNREITKKHHQSVNQQINDANDLASLRVKLDVICD